MTGRPASPDDLTLTFENPRAERIKKVAQLAGRSARSRAGQFLVEGPQGVREAVACAPARVRDIYVTADALARHRDVVADALAAELWVHLATDAVVQAISSDAQGIVAVVQTSGDSLDDVLAQQPRLVAVLSNVRDPGNAGTVIRAADAAGAQAVILAGESVDITNPKVVRSTAGSLFHLPIVRAPLADAVAALHDAGITVLAADGSGDAELGGEGAADEDIAVPTAWVFGNEAWGLTADELALADLVVRIPIYGRAESLNLATAASVCLYASARAQRA
ncbi:TrmH family RNA methyltransferase [Demequina activiva]|uniref:RNA methyltransferase n=1 Tax=Demequina activiva TaxID=1582364 RepID=A0A919UJY4_9MICO|nr:RNA methyltransferase [Demequina activiva]GIG54325.1 RNA methyltransferase [Demequina activiva]